MLAIISDRGKATVVDRPTPEMSSTQVRVRTRAAALNNADLSVSGDETAGFEFAGIVEAVGESVPETLLGARVMGIGIGAFAEIVVADHRHLLVMPEELDFAHASALPVGLSTEYGALKRASLRTGDVVLITAATSGIAHIGLQVARAMGAGLVLGTTRTEAGAGLLLRAGADHAIVLDGSATLADRVHGLSEGAGADVVLDHVSGTGLADAIDAARVAGTVVSVGRITGPTAEIDLFRLARQQVALQSVSYGLTPPEAMGSLMAGTAELLHAVAIGHIRPIVDSQVPFADAQRAYDRLASSSADGKVVLTFA